MVITDRQTGKSRGYGFVSCADGGAGGVGVACMEGATESLAGKLRTAGAGRNRNWRWARGVGVWSEGLGARARTPASWSGAAP